MSVEEFLRLAEKQGWHFTVSWVKKRLKQLEEGHE